MRLGSQKFRIGLALPLSLPLIAWMLIQASSAFARGDAGEATPPTFLFDMTGGYSIYKSAMVQSNDTSTTVGYGYGVYAGENHNLGMLLEHESSTFAFKLNSSTIGLTWQDTHLRYRLGPAHVGFLMSTSTWTVKAPPADAAGTIDPKGTAVDYIDIISTGYGGDLGVQIPVGRRGSVYTNATYVTSGFVQQKAAPAGSDAATVTASERKTTLGPRLDMDFGGSMGLSQHVFDGICGFKYRTYQLTVDTKTYKEQMNTTYFGIRANVSF